MSSRADMKALFRQKQQERAKTSGAVAKPLSALPADFFDTSSANKKQKINEDKVEARAVKATPPEGVLGQLRLPSPPDRQRKALRKDPPEFLLVFLTARQVLKGEEICASAAGQKEEVAAESSNESKLPKGFFDDKEKDNAARGVVVEKKKPEDAYKEFQQAIEVDMKEMEELEEHEAEAAATERAERVEFEQKQQMSVVAEFRAESQKRIQELREKRNVARDIAKRQAKGDISDSDEDEDEDDDFDNLDWRAKSF
eukprot:gene2271-2990_t